MHSSGASLTPSCNNSHHPFPEPSISPQGDSVPVKHGLSTPCPSPGSHPLLSVCAEGTPPETSWEWGPAGRVLLGLAPLAEPGVLGVPLRVAGVRVPFLLWLDSIEWIGHIFFIHLSINGRLPSFQLLEVASNATVNRGVQVSSSPFL